MNIDWVDDWPDRRKRLEAFWYGDALDRAALQITAQVRPFPDIAAPDSLEHRWTDIDYRLAQMELGGNLYYGGESIPNMWCNLGPGCTASFLGSGIDFKPETCWFEHIVQDWDSFEFRIDPDNRWWKLIKDMTAAAVAASKGRYFVGHTDLSGVTDILSHLCGPDKLCVDMLERPEKVVKARAAATKIWFGLYEELYDIVNRDGQMEGSCSWMGIWHPGKTYPLQCDFSCMISPRMFEDYVLPELVEQGRYLDHVIYHLDGPGAVRHLDALLAAPEITGIQWIQGSGGGPILQWLPLLKKVQRAGKMLTCWAGMDEAKTLLEELSPRGLLLHMGCYDSRETVDEFIRFARKAASDRGKGRT
ncbi:MAG: hypothetical protein Q7T82_01035 [Armatimonadota bacterium]|nr:hypothetical protein [Armatimonadota bacterium]